MHFVDPESLPLNERVGWIFWGWLWGNPLPVNMAGWMPNKEQWDSNKKYARGLFARMRSWKFLAPFFLDRGYTLYKTRLDARSLTSPEGLHPADGKFMESVEPDAEGHYSRHTGGVEFDFNSWRVWPARDTKGREVVIKIVSCGSSPSAELEALQRFNVEPLRSDTRNHIIRVLDFISFGPLKFAVMPRWDSAWHHPFHTVGDLVHFMENMLEGLDFMHENRVVHRDLGIHNAGMNCITDDTIKGLTKIRYPSVARYTVFDFGIALVYPIDTSIEDVKVSGPGFYFNHLVVDPEVPRNPFTFEVACLGSSLQFRVQHAENIILALGPFF
ncbi:hypothetical protein B0H11DRAFT_161503 [Mycena galericulata]|nr:hypothetical protein B0H11DRAFT_161503 [Mycena galericulata]